MTDSRVEALTSAAEAHVDRPGDDHSHVLDAEEVFIEGAEELGADVEAILDTEIEWVATHRIGDYDVQEREFVNGLRYWVEADGKRRRPTKTNPLRRFAPKPEPARQMFLDKRAFSLVMTAYFSEEIDHAEDQWGNIAQRIDSEHVLVSKFNRALQTHDRYLIQIPEEFEVAGMKMP